MCAIIAPRNKQVTSCTQYVSGTDHYPKYKPVARKYIHMNSKSLVFVVFAVWSVICWRWYVCGLMGACGENTRTHEEVVAIPDSRLDTVSISETPEIQPIDNPKSARPSQTVTSNNKTTKPVSPANMDHVQMESVADRMLIHFPYKSTTREDNAAIEDYLDNLALELSASGKKVTITGHTDFVGEPAGNYSFGMRRAYGIRDILIKKGVSPKQILCKSYGDKKPVATNDTPYGRYLNRRAEIKINQ